MINESELTRFSDENVAKVFDTYPEPIKTSLLRLRQLIMDTAAGLEDLNGFQETLKWGEPSSLCKQGSTIRLGWQQNHPKQYKLMFHCQTKLIDSFREVFPDELRYEGNRAIVFHDQAPINKDVLRQCILAALRYHKIKQLDLLGLP